jgi:hypothetical protein
MIKTTYFCDCCKQIIPDDADHIQMVPMNETVDVFNGTLEGYEKMVDAHFCRACTDKIISFMFNPADIDALKRGIDESNTIIDTLNAELEEARRKLEAPAEDTEESGPPAPGSAKAKQRMTGKRSPVDKQQVIRLYRDNHMTYQQIADRVGCSVSTVYGVVSKYNKTAPAPTEEPVTEEEQA